MKFVILGGVLGEAGANAHVRGVYLNHELKGGVRVGEDGGGGEQGLEVGEGCSGLWRPGERDRGESETSEGGGDVAEVSDKAAVKVSEAEEALQLF